ncbi:alpha/beta fold hydrolase [Actinoplanes sp. NBC_00393]|uniref:alpha/beta fold hydrolase n=1 Tax=Actinoplanes sp. NBC_00393 TaxID=2975953 RepID=UPI002E1CE9FD
MTSERHSGSPGSFRRLSRDLLRRAYPDGDREHLDSQARVVAGEVKHALRSDGLAGRTDAHAADRRLPGRFAFIAGALGVLLGAAAGWLMAAPASGVAPVAAAAVTGLSSLGIYWALLRRKQLTGVTEGVIQLSPDTLRMLGTGEHTPGHGVLHYLEAKRESDELVVLVHGLGLDATDFRAYLAETQYNAVALTLYGFNPDDKDDEEYSPISLESHAQLFARAIRHLQAQHPGKRISLVGFSVGADIILMLSKLAGDVLRDLQIHRVLLLDPNINRDTMVISKRIADVDVDQPLQQFKDLLTSATSIEELRYLCSYVFKAANKDMDQVRRHAQDIRKVWEDQDGVEQFVEYLTQLTKICSGIFVLLSLGEKDLLMELRDKAFDFGLSPNNFGWSRSGHFELLDPSFLRQQIDYLLQ